MKLLKFTAMMLMTLFVIGVSSCSKKSAELQALIPADADILMSLDIEAVLENADCTVGSDGITLSNTLSQMLKTGDEADKTLEKVLSINSIDYSQVYIITNLTPNFNPDATLVASVTNVDNLSSSLSEMNLQNEMVDGYLVYKLDDMMSLYIRDNVMWMTNGVAQSAIEKIEALKKSAGSKSLADVQWATDYLNKGKGMAMLVNLSKLPSVVKAQMAASASLASEAVKKMLDGYFAVNIELSGLNCVLTVTGFSAEGEQLNISQLPEGVKALEINPAFLKYLNADNVLVAAGSIPENYPWNDVLKSIATQAGVPAAQLQMAIPYLETLQGTIALSVGPKNGVSSFSNGYSRLMDNYDGILFVSFKDNKANEYFEMIPSLLGQMNMKVTSVDDKTSALELDKDMKVYFGVRGNMLVIATRPIEETDSSLFSASDFKGQYGEVIFKLDKDTRLATDLALPFGVYSRIFTEGNVGVWNTELTSCTGKFLANIIDYAAGARK